MNQTPNAPRELRRAAELASHATHQNPNATRERLLRRAAELAGQQAEVARMLADLDTSERTYSSLDLPPDLAQAPAGRRTFREWCAGGLVEGAEKAGRVWLCSAAAWRQARIKTPIPRPRFVPEAEAPAALRGMKHEARGA